MRIIPKKTKVSMEFFKGIEIPDVLVGTVGITIVISVLFSNLPYRMGIALGIAVLFGASIIPIDGDKGYQLIYNVLKYLARYRVFKEEPAKRENRPSKILLRLPVLTAASLNTAENTTVLLSAFRISNLNFIRRQGRTR